MNHDAPPTTGDYDEDWYDDFWTNIDPGADDQISAVRLIGEMFAAGLIWRDGDTLTGRGGPASRLDLSTDDQHLIRRIEDAAAAASSPESEAHQ